MKTRDYINTTNKQMLGDALRLLDGFVIKASSFVNEEEFHETMATLQVWHQAHLQGITLDD